MWHGMAWYHTSAIAAAANVIHCSQLKFKASLWTVDVFMFNGTASQDIHIRFKVVASVRRWMSLKVWIFN